MGIMTPHWSKILKQSSFSVEWKNMGKFCRHWWDETKLSQNSQIVEYSKKCTKKTYMKHKILPKFTLTKAN